MIVPLIGVVKYLDKLGPLLKTAKAAKVFNKLKHAEIVKLSPTKLKELTPSNWQFSSNGKTTDDFIHIRDSSGAYRIRIDKPDKVTTYRHIHIFDANGNALDISGSVINAKNKEAHIPYNY